MICLPTFSAVILTHCCLPDQIIKWVQEEKKDRLIPATYVPYTERISVTGNSPYCVGSVGILNKNIMIIFNRLICILSFVGKVSSQKEAAAGTAWMGIHQLHDSGAMVG